MIRSLVAIPIYNEQKYLLGVLSMVRRYAGDILAIDDGSTDQTPELLDAQAGLHVIHHPRNLGYGQSMIDAFAFALERGYDWVITIDCDLQHRPCRIPAFLHQAARDDADVISGSRYLDIGVPGDLPPEDRRRINFKMTGLINERLGLSLTDAFCGFKAYRVSAMARLRLTEPGYAFPMQFWVQAAAAGLRIREIPVTLIYNDPNRRFGDGLDDAHRRLNHYLDVFYQELHAAASGADESSMVSEASGASCCRPCRKP